MRLNSLGRQRMMPTATTILLHAAPMHGTRLKSTKSVQAPLGPEFEVKEKVNRERFVRVLQDQIISGLGPMRKKFTVDIDGKKVGHDLFHTAHMTLITFYASSTKHDMTSLEQFVLPTRRKGITFELEYEQDEDEAELELKIKWSAVEDKFCKYSLSEFEHITEREAESLEAAGIS